MPLKRGMAETGHLVKLGVRGEVGGAGLDHKSNRGPY